MPLTIDQNLNPQKDNDSLAQVESQGDIRSIMAKIRNIYDQLKSSNPSQSQFLMQEITQLIIQVSSMPGGAEAISAFIEDAKAREQAIRTSAPTVAKLNQESVIGSGDNVTNDPQPTPEGMVLNMVVDVLKDMALSKAFDDIPQDETEVNATSKQAEKSEAVTEASAAVIRKYVAQYGEKALLNPAIAEKNNIRDTFLGPQIAAQMDAHRRKKQLEKGDAYMQTQSSEIRADIIEKRETRAKAREANDVDAEIVNSKGLFDSDELEFVVKAQSMPKKTKLSDEQVAKLKEAGQALREERANAKSIDDDIVPLGSFFDEEVERIPAKSQAITKASDTKTANSAPATEAVKEQAKEHAAESKGNQNRIDLAAPGIK